MDHLQRNHGHPRQNRRLYSCTGALLVVQLALGHRHIATTEIYTHLVDGAVEAALERL